MRLSIKQIKRSLRLRRIGILTFILILKLPILHAQNEDQSLTPYIQIVKENSDLELLPLLSTITDVRIAGVIADVTVTQVFQNSGDQPIEARYLFPASTRAAVYDMKMKIGESVVAAIIQEKEKARATYNKAKDNGQRASLLEQERPNIFSMNIANILPGDQIEVVLQYTETIIPEEGIYSFVYPTVVGPRYTGESSVEADHHAGGVPYTAANAAPDPNFDIAVTLQSGMPLQDVSSPSHDIKVTYSSMDQATVQLENQLASDRDFVLNYTLSGKRINSGLLLYEGEEENYFMLTIQPPARIETTDIPDREYVFVLDVSGSMHGFPLNTTKKVMRNLLGNLRSTDRFNVMLFAGRAKTYASASVLASYGEIEKAISFIDAQGGSGGTRLLNALNQVVKLPKCQDGISRSVVVVTDGYINVEREAYDIIRNNSNEFNFYAFGIGSSVNRYLIEGIAHMGNGEPLFVLNQSQAAEKADRFRKYIQHPVLTDIDINFSDFDVYDVEPVLLSDVLAERPLVITGKYRGELKGKIEITGVTGDYSDFRGMYKVADGNLSSDNKSIPYLWARQRIQFLDDYSQVSQDSNLVTEVTQLGLEYNLLTRYTSFVAVDETPVFANSSNTNTVQQPLAVPYGVSNKAIGNFATYANHAHGMGAELAISNVLTEGTLHPMSIHLSNEDFSKFQLQFLLSQLRYKLKSIVEGLDTCGVSLKIELTLTGDGKVGDILIANNACPEYQDMIVSEMKAWEALMSNGQLTSVIIELI